MTKRKRKPRSRRVLTPTSRPAVPSSPATRLSRASAAATLLGACALAAALAIQFGLSPWPLGSRGSTALRVAGISLVIAGIVLGRTRR